MYDPLIAPATTAQADAILASWDAQQVRPLETRNAAWPAPLVQIMGDFPAPTRAEVVQRARRLARRPDFRHAVRLLDLRGLRTAEVPDARLDDLIEALFVPGELPWSAGPEAIAEAELARPLEVLPFRMVIGDRYVTVRRSHVFGDLYAGSRTFPQFVLADADDVPAPTTYRAPLTRALAHTIATRPGSLVRAFRADRSEPEAHLATGEPQLWQRGLCYATSADGFVADLKAGSGAGVSLGGWLTAALHRATREVGIAAHPGALVVADCRRYLPPTSRHLSGNFVAGSFLPMPDPTDPVVATAAIRQYAGSARPLLAMALSQRSDGHAIGAAAPRDRLPDPDGRAYLALSHSSGLPWPSRSVPVPGCAYNVPTAIGKDGISAVTLVIGGRLSVSLGYAQGQYDRAAMQHVADALTGRHAVARR